MDAPDRLCLMTVHAHPDDEASKGAASVTKVHAEGVKTVLVCCTGGEAGEILNPALQGDDDVLARLPEIRMEELRRSVEIIGYDELVLLGYRDSGMPGTEENLDPRSFAQADLDEAVGRLVSVIREHRPQVLVIYADDQSGYPHPDHLRVHEIGMIAFEAAGDPDRYPDTGEAWQPLKLYYSAWSRARMLAMHEKFVELGLESPFDRERLDRPAQDERITTRVDISEFADIRPAALLAHRTQVDPESPFWFGLPPEESRLLHPYDDYILARSLVDPAPGDDPGICEDDLFAGLRAPAQR